MITWLILESNFAFIQLIFYTWKTEKKESDKCFHSVDITDLQELGKGGFDFMHCLCNLRKVVTNS